MHAREREAAAARGDLRPVVGTDEALAGQVVQIPPFQMIARREGDGMDDAVQAVPALAQFLEYALDLGVVTHVQGQHDVGTHFSGGGLDALLQLVVLIGEGELRAFAVHGLGGAPGDGTVAGDADDEDLLVVQKAHGDSVV